MSNIDKILRETDPSNIEYIKQLNALMETKEVQPFDFW